MATDYVELITNAHANSPRFAANIALMSKAFNDIQAAALNLLDAFNLDTAVGVQLDQVGQWVGISRRLNVPIEDAFFTWDDPDLGWNAANWKGPFEPTEGITSLDDETYRAVIKAKIASNYWDGSNEAVQEIGETAFAGLGVQCFVIDNQDMSITIYILGTPTAALLELIKRGVAPPKPAGVRVAGYILASAPGAPFFALSVLTTSVTAGLDFGSFGDPI